MNLGELIDALKSQPADRDLRIAGPSAMIPTEPRSYRGYYEDLALGYEVTHNSLKVGDYVKTLESVVGETFEGYKGGDYRMSRSTRVWISGYGYASGCLVSGVDSDKNSVWITTSMEHW